MAQEMILLGIHLVILVRSILRMLKTSNTTWDSLAWFLALGLRRVAPPSGPTWLRAPLPSALFQCPKSQQIHSVVSLPFKYPRSQHIASLSCLTEVTKEAWLIHVMWYPGLDSGTGKKKGHLGKWGHISKLWTWLNVLSWFINGDTCTMIVRCYWWRNLDVEYKSNYLCNQSVWTLELFFLKISFKKDISPSNSCCSWFRTPCFCFKISCFFFSLWMWCLPLLFWGFNPYRLNAFWEDDPNTYNSSTIKSLSIEFADNLLW